MPPENLNNQAWAEKIVPHLLYQLQFVSLVILNLQSGRVDSFKLDGHLPPHGVVHGPPLLVQVPVVLAQHVAQLRQGSLWSNVTARDDSGIYQGLPCLIDTTHSTVTALLLLMNICYIGMVNIPT